MMPTKNKDKPQKSIEELEFLHEQANKQITELEKAVTKRRLELIRQGKLLELLRRIRALERTPEMQEVLELAADVGL